MMYIGHSLIPQLGRQVRLGTPLLLLHTFARCVFFQVRLMLQAQHQATPLKCKAVNSSDSYSHA